MKKYYSSPEWKLLLIAREDVLSFSIEVPDPEDNWTKDY